MDVFKLAHEFTLKVYKATETFPQAERFGLVSQMRRAASSICANLMEGGHRFGKNEYKHFVSIAKGSAGEMKYHLLLSKDLGYIENDVYQQLVELAERVCMMLSRLHGSIK